MKLHETYCSGETATLQLHSATLQRTLPVINDLAKMQKRTLPFINDLDAPPLCVTGFRVRDVPNLSWWAHRRSV